MRKRKDEPYEQWIEKVRLFEYGVALQRIAKGDDVEIVLNSMSKRINQKLLHPLIECIKESYQTDYDPLNARKQYEEKYLKNSNRVADHMNDVL
jgi:glutamyl-tRNA reductase